MSETKEQIKVKLNKINQTNTPISKLHQITTTTTTAKKYPVESCQVKPKTNVDHIQAIDKTNKNKFLLNFAYI